MTLINHLLWFPLRGPKPGFILFHTTDFAPAKGSWGHGPINRSSGSRPNFALSRYLAGIGTAKSEIWFAWFVENCAVLRSSAKSLTFGGFNGKSH